MISCEFFYRELRQNKIDFFTGVPDTLLKDFNAYISDHCDSYKHIIAANEGGAIALACGYYLSTRNTALVYMQNSGQGNSINPLISLADRQVYSIPILLLIGWRGEPGQKDEPQHIQQGQITLPILDILKIPYHVLPQSEKEAKKCLKDIFYKLKNSNAPAALIVKKSTFEPYQIKKHNELQLEMTRESAIKTVTDCLDESCIIVSTTGKISRELFEYREKLGKNHQRDFLTIGSMGHSSMIALGIALSKPGKQVFCFDGDGSVIMHMGAMAIIGSHRAHNLKHIIFNNGSHDSVGGQPTAGFSISFTELAKACKYETTLQAVCLSDLKKKTEQLKATDGPALLEVKVRRGSRKNLGRPTIPPQQNKADFMRFLAD